MAAGGFLAGGSEHGGPAGHAVPLETGAGEGRSQARAQPDGRVISHNHLARSSAYAVDSRPDGSPAEYSGTSARRVANQPRRPVAPASNSQVGIGRVRWLQARLQ